MKNLYLGIILVVALGFAAYGLAQNRLAFLFLAGALIVAAIAGFLLRR